MDVRPVLAITIAVGLAFIVGCNSPSQFAKESAAESRQPADSREGNPPHPTELEGEWDSTFALFATVGGSKYIVKGNGIVVQTAHPVGDDKADMRVEMATEAGRFQIVENEGGKRLQITLESGSEKTMEYILKNDQLEIWPIGNKGLTQGFRRRGVPPQFPGQPSAPDTNASLRPSDD